MFRIDTGCCVRWPFPKLYISSGTVVKQLQEDKLTFRNCLFIVLWKNIFQLWSDTFLIQRMVSDWPHCDITKGYAAHALRKVKGRLLPFLISWSKVSVGEEKNIFREVSHLKQILYDSEMKCSAAPFCPRLEQVPAALRWSPTRQLKRCKRKRKSVWK